MQTCSLVSLSAFRQFLKNSRHLYNQYISPMCEHQRIYGFEQSCRFYDWPCLWHDVWCFIFFMLIVLSRTKLHFRLAHGIYAFERDIKQCTIYVEVNNLVCLQRVNDVCVCMLSAFFLSLERIQNRLAWFAWMIANKDMVLFIFERF